MLQFIIPVMWVGTQGCVCYVFQSQHTAVGYILSFKVDILGYILAELEIVTKICSANLSELSKFCSAIVRFWSDIKQCMWKAKLQHEFGKKDKWHNRKLVPNQLQNINTYTNCTSVTHVMCKIIAQTQWQTKQSFDQTKAWNGRKCLMSRLF